MSRRPVGLDEWDGVPFGLDGCTNLRTLHLDFCSEVNPLIDHHWFKASLLRQILAELYTATGPDDLTLILDLPRRERAAGTVLMETVDHLDAILGPYMRRGLRTVRILETHNSLAGDAAYCADIAARVPVLKKRGILRFWCASLVYSPRFTVLICFWRR